MTSISNNSDVNVTIAQRRTFRNRLSIRLPSVYSRKSSHAQSPTLPSLGPFTPSSFPHSPTVPLSLPLSKFSSLSMDNTLAVSSIAVPPTTNDLGPHQKALLLKKTRKLSRVFGEEPSSIHQASRFHPHAAHGHVGQPSSSSSSSHRRSVSSISTATSQSSSRPKQLVHRAPSQPDIRTSLLDEGSESTPHLPNARVSEYMDNSSLISGIGAATPVADLRRIRTAKLHRRLGDDKLTPPRNIDNLRFRKSLDAIPVMRQSSRRSSDGQLRRTRSTLSEPHKKVGPLVDDPVAFHRRYVQNFGCEGRVTQATRKQHQVTESRSPKSTSGVVGGMEDGLVPADEFESESSHTNLRSSTAFQERRRRAAKLAQFFGVGYHDLSSSLPISDLVSHPSAYRPPPQMPAVQVDIAMKSGRFWGNGDDRWTYKDKDADMLDVINKLRDLKA